MAGIGHCLYKREKDHEQRNPIKQCPIVTTHWWPKTRNERFGEKTNSIYIVFYLLYTTMSKWSECAHTSGVWRVCVRRSGSRCIHTGRRRQRLTEGVSEAWCWRAVIVTTTNHILLWCCMNGIGYCMRRSDWLTPPLALEKLRQQPRFRHALRQALTPTPVWMQREPEHAHTHVTHRMRVRTQITWTWVCTRGKKLYKYCSFSHTNRSFRVLGHQCVVTMGNCLIWISLCMFFFPLIETVTYTCHYMTDRLERFWPKNIKIGSTEEKKDTHILWMPLG